MDKNEVNLFPVDDEGRCGIEASRDDIIDHFLLNEMEGQEREAFLEHILFCSACNQELQFRERVVDNLRKEPVSETIGRNARFVQKKRAGSLPSSETDKTFSPAVWLKFAAVFIGLLTLTYGWYYLSTPTLSTWAQIAVLESSAYNPQYFQSDENNRGRSYNQGLSLLFQAQRKNWLRPGFHFDKSRVKEAIESLQESYALPFPEDRKMDIVYYLAKANLMLDNPREALNWLEKTKDIGANRAKIQRAIRLCQQIQMALEAELKKHNSDSRRQELTAWQAQVRQIRNSLQTLISQ